MTSCVAVSTSIPTLNTLVGHLTHQLESCRPLPSTSETAPLEPSTNDAPVPVVDAYTISPDGHFVGVDGYVVPASYGEFLERHPLHIRNFVRRHMAKSSRDDQQDREQELHLYLMTLPEVTIYRAPGYNGRPEGCSDRVQTFHPERSYGASKPRFLNFINYLLIHAFISLAKKAHNNPVVRTNNLIIVTGALADATFVDDEYLHYAIPSISARSQVLQDAVENHVVLDEVQAYVETHNPELASVFQVLLSCDTYIEAQQTLGLSDQLFTRARNRLQDLMECYASGSQPPTQRKVYRPRKPKAVSAPQHAAEGAAA